MQKDSSVFSTSWWTDRVALYGSTTTSDTYTSSHCLKCWAQYPQCNKWVSVTDTSQTLHPQLIIFLLPVTVYAFWSFKSFEVINLASDSSTLLNLALYKCLYLNTNLLLQHKSKAHICIISTPDEWKFMSVCQVNSAWPSLHNEYQPIDSDALWLRNKCM